MLDYIRKHYQEEFKINPPYKVGSPSLFEFEAGSDLFIKQECPIEEQLKVLNRDAEEFREIRKKYLIY